MVEVRVRPANLKFQNREDLDLQAPYISRASALNPKHPNFAMEPSHARSPAAAESQVRREDAQLPC